jgi:prepilin-type N-terminal cleavage/methylation domain-containing protein
MKQRGFTLMETLAVMVVLGIAAATIITLQATVFARHSDNKDLQTGAQAVHECAEQVLAMRRRAPGSGYAAVTTAACNSLGGRGGFGAPTVSLRDDSGTSVAACASSFCTATISAAKAGSTVAPITLRLSKY